MMTNDVLARSFKALAHPRRAMIFQLLARNPQAGNSLDRLRRTTKLRTSSLVHHLREMERCGLIRRRRHGPEVAYRLVTAELNAALDTASDISRTARHAAMRQSRQAA